QLVDIGAVVGRNGRAGAACKMQDLIVDLIRLREALERGVNHATNFQRIAATGDDHNELVAAQSANLATRSDDFGEPRSDLDQEQVAGGMAERVVHVLEAVEIEHHDGGRLLGAAAGQETSQLLLQ